MQEVLYRKQLNRYWDSVKPITQGSTTAGRQLTLLLALSLFAVSLRRSVD